jgi:glucosamine--fructose-6-phosphate aminotransferase (isomerizing)
MIERLQQLKAETLVITEKRHSGELAGARCICLPMKLAVRGAKPEEVYTPIPYIVPAQLFAASLAACKGINPDQPRTISKVTRTM